LEIDNVVVYPNPYRPIKGDLQINFEITQNCKIIKVKIYTTGYRLIKQISYSGNYGAGTNHIEIESKYVDKMANGVYYIIIEAINTRNEKITSKPKAIVILK